MMKAFTLAALPWILAGLAVAIICAGMDKQKSTKKEKEAEAFRCRRIIESISENRLSVAKYRIGSSNIMKVLDKYLERCTDT